VPQGADKRGAPPKGASDSLFTQWHGTSLIKMGSAEGSRTESRGGWVSDHRLIFGLELSTAGSPKFSFGLELSPDGSPNIFGLEIAHLIFL